MSKLTAEVHKHGMRIRVDDTYIPSIERVEPLEVVSDGLVRVHLALLVSEVSWVDYDGVAHDIDINTLNRMKEYMDGEDKS